MGDTGAVEQAGRRGSRTRLSFATLVAAVIVGVVVPVASGEEPPAPLPIQTLDAGSSLAATASKPATRIGKITSAPTTTSTTSTSVPTSTTPGATTTTVVKSGTTLFPMAPTPKCAVLSNFGDSRSGGRTHQGIDILATQGQEVYAVADGTLTTQYLDAAGTLTGNGWKLTLPDKTSYAYLHLDSFAPGLVEGSVVVRGQLIGYVGDTGNDPGNYHLHFEYHPRGGAAVNPLPYLAIPAGCVVW